MRQIVRKMLFGVRSDAAIKTLTADRLEEAARVVRHFETAVADPEQQINVKDEAHVVSLLASCLDLEKDRQENVGVM